MNKACRTERADVVVIVPLPEEFEALRRVLPFQQVDVERCPPVLPTLYEATVRELRVVACVLHEMANEHSSLITERCIHHFAPGLVVGLGIAGSLDRDVLLGDVVMSRTVENFVFESKAVPKKGGYRLQQSANGSMSVDHALYEYGSSFEATKPDRVRGWQDAGAARMKELGLSPTSGDGEKPKTVSRERPAFKIGAIASGPSVGAATAYVAEIKTIGRDFRALEMEGAGIARACQKRGLEHQKSFFLLRGISDFSDRRKSLLEDASRGGWRKLAAENAARMLHTMLSDPTLPGAASAPASARKRASDGRPILRVVVMWNDTVHYVSSINEGFRSELRARLEEQYEIVFSEGVGSPEKEALPANEAKMKTLVAQFGDDDPTYVVTIGTAVTVAAIRALSRRDRLLFLGVSDPEALGLQCTPKGERPLVTGVRYGLPIAQTIALLKLVCPDRTPVFVYSGDAYPQDATLCHLIEKNHGKDVELLSLPSPQRLAADGASKVYFGRFFFCRNMATFFAHNPEVPLVGVSKENLGFGATLTIGYEPEEIGRIGAEELIKDFFAKEKLTDGRIIEPKEAILAVSRSKLRKFGIALPPKLPGGVHVYGVA